MYLLFFRKSEKFFINLEFFILMIILIIDLINSYFFEEYISIYLFDLFLYPINFEIFKYHSNLTINSLTYFK